MIIDIIGINLFLLYIISSIKYLNSVNKIFMGLESYIII